MRRPSNRPPAFHPDTLAMLHDAYAVVDAEFVDKLTDRNRGFVREAMAVTVMVLAKSGRLNPHELRNAAIDKARRLLS